MNAQIVTVNLIPDLSTPAVVRVSQYDVGRPLTFKVLDGTGTASFDATTTATVTGTKPSGLGFTESGTIAGNTVTLSTTLAMTQECGKIPTEIRFTQTGEDIGTANFILAVEPSPHPEGTTDGTQETMANLETRLQGEIDALDSRIDAIEGDQSIIDDIDALDARVTALEQGGSGLSQTEKNLILTLFSKAAYAEDDASTAYDALEAMWASTTKTITYNLTDVMSSNTQTSIESGQPYSTALAVRQNYTLNSVSVTMGGVDITSTAYSSGTVSIPSVTGNIVITATAVPSTSDTTAQIETEGYVSEHTGTGTSASNYRQTAKTYGGITIKYQLDEATTSLQLAGIIPFADSTITKGVGCLIIYDSTDTIVNHLDEQSNTSPNRWAQLATGTLTEFVSTLYTVGTYSQITFSVDTRYLADAYMYDYVTGQVFFAGENTPYYGKHNISEVTT